ncbi:MAG: hypothetical protein EA401_01165 [Planctomycetota bacterium]|nr:MAG: hypothetical protein EA401_01165 [Planctomycetota bacterium]
MAEPDTIHRSIGGIAKGAQSLFLVIQHLVGHGGDYVARLPRTRPPSAISPYWGDWHSPFLGMGFQSFNLGRYRSYMPNTILS